jgi:hypothetical protein|tara:strand:- start:419 stop:1045 length:627 start_codon:yes stop_codon:yes gene_type:complete
MSCDLKGGTRVRMTVDDIRTQLSDAERFAGAEFDVPEYLVPANHDVITWASDTYGLDAAELGLLYDVREHRAVFPIMHEGKIVDATGRALNKRLPKWRRYGKSGLPYAHGCGKVAVVVEDCVSAAVVGGGNFVGIAVLGTSLSDAHKKFLTQFSTAVIALDPDAVRKTLLMAKELRGHVDDVRVLYLTDDLKYRNPTDMTNLADIGDV